LPEGKLDSEISIEELHVNVLFGLSFQGFDKFVVHGPGVSLVQGSNGNMVAGG
jgi:hypothetical protein